MDREPHHGRKHPDDKDQYFSYYALLSHQAQMLQDSVRTSTYQKAIHSNAEQCFRDKIVIDVGAGNGILSIFSAQAGARKVYAVEASNMVQNLQHFVDASLSSRKLSKNSWLGERLKPIHSKMEDVTADMLDGNEKCDTVVSECLGVLLVHERMCESFIDARDRFLKPGGAVLPSAGTICLAPMEDKVVWEEAANKARFWDNRHGKKSFHRQLSDALDLLSFSLPRPTTTSTFSPLPRRISKVYYSTIFDVAQTAVVHGLAGWFDLHFLPPSAAPTSGSGEDILTEEEMMTLTPELEMKIANAVNTTTTTKMNSSDAIIDFGLGLGSDPLLAPPLIDPTISPSYMTTSPFATPTHWQQVRFLFQEPLAINKGQRIVGEMLCEVNDFRSYTLTATFKIDGSNDELLTRHCHWRLDRQVYSWTSASPSTQ